MSQFYKCFPRLSTAINFSYRALRLYLSNHSFKAYLAAGSHVWKRMRGRPTPTFVTVAVTYSCQCRCEHCYASTSARSVREELTSDQLRSVIRQVRDLGSLAVHFSGGEPLLREDIFDLVSYAHEIGLLTRINSNGILLNRDNVKRLKAAGLTECGVSLDSAEPSAHDRFRGVPNLHEQAVQGIRLLRRFGVRCRIMTVASKESIPEGLARTIALGRSLGASYMYVLLPIAVGGWERAYAKVLNYDERQRIRALQDLTFAHLELPTERTNCCVYRKSILYVSANGNVTPCAFVPYVLGNVREKPLDVIWRHHCAGLNMVCRGDCPMNVPAQRDALREHVARVSQELGSASMKTVHADS